MPNEDIKVTVHFVASPRQLEEAFPRSATVGQVRTAAMAFFGLSEGDDGHGNTIILTIYLKSSPLTDLSQTLDNLAGDGPSLQLKLVQQITQG